ncbi:MAG: AbrB/MazE/SpoVT family DNA-binding domain-containing protein [Candidatus Saccharimonadales bacterium]
MEKHRIELAATVTLGPKGQVVIPADVREKMNIKPGDKLIALYLPDKKAISFVTDTAMQSLVDQMGNHLETLRKSLSK